MTRDWTEEQVAAFVDGSLEDEAEAEAVRRTIETDPEARALAERIRESNALLREAFDTPEDAPMPAAIQAAIFGEPDKVAVLPRRRAIGGWMPTAIAASIALAIGVGAGSFIGGPEQQRIIAALGDAPLDGPLHAALETLPSGSTSDAGIQPVLTFRAGDGRACREFDVLHELPDKAEFGIACRGPEGRWNVEMVVAAPVTETGPSGYATASGAAAQALDAMLDALGASPSLTPEDEAALLRGRWDAAE